MNLKTCAEGIENEDQKLLMKDYGCNIAQGYLFSKPLTEDDIRNWLGRGTG
jgi:EAL domain-containing protein (putative c-di-GMP-specific phosphodiesterase class I)